MTAPRRRLPTSLYRSLTERVDRDHQQPDQAFRRRRWVTAVFAVIGAILLGISLSVRPADPAFYPLTAGLAATWVIGGFLSGPLHLGRVRTEGGLRRPWLSPLLIGFAAAGVYVLGALVVREIEPLRAYTEQVLAHARYGTLPLVVMVTVLNGIAEEIFFRGAVFAAIGRRRAVLASTLLYGMATLATGNPMLVFAALTLGPVLALQRQASGGILAPIITHVTWSTTMLFVLPALFTV